MDTESLKKRIHALLDTMHSEADPLLLNQYRSIFRQEVSFFRRSYLAAYLLMLGEQDGRGKRGGRPVRDDSAYRKNTGERRRRVERNVDVKHMLPDAEAAQLFVGIGRKRRVFPGEIVAFLATKAQVKGDDIGAIKMLDNFSFVQVRKTVADTIIQAMEGQNFRGKPLTVNYARSRIESPVEREDLTDGENPAEQGDD